VLHRFWLIRHALVHADSLSSLYGTNDVPVCDTTMEAQAPRYAALAARLPHPARLICSPLKRTQITAEALVRAGRAFLYDALDEAWATVSAGRTLAIQERAMLWLAATEATSAATKAVELLFSAGGSASLYAPPDSSAA